MAGHSHWANIARKKSVIDAKRGKFWSKLSKAIIVAAKMGGGDPAANARLRVAIEAARAVSMPKDNIQRAIKKGAGELDSGNFEEMLYEGYGPGGAAVLCEILTDNRNRTAGEVRKLFELSGGKLGESGCVAWMFTRRGVFVIPRTATEEDRLMELALEVGADDVRHEEDTFQVICEPGAFQQVLDGLIAAGIEPSSSQIVRLPNSTVDLDAENGRKILKLIDGLDDHDDVQSVTSNFNIPDEAMAALG